MFLGKVVKMKFLCSLLLLLWCLLDHGVSGVGSDEVSVMEGDSVTLHTDVKTNKQDRIRWYYNDTRIAQINGNQSKTCTDVQCEGGDERFRHRLKLDHQTGSLTITNTRNTDSGDYQLKIISTSSDSEKAFSVRVQGVSAAERDEVKRKSVMEGESVTLDPGVMKNPNDVMMWYFNDILIAEITGDQSQICTDDQCKDGDEGFRDRLKVNQSRSLTITNTRTTDSGLYKLQISSSRIGSSFSIRRIKKNFNVTVSGSGPSSTALTRLSVVGLVVVAAAVAAAVTAAVIYCRKHQPRSPSGRAQDSNQETDVRYSSVSQNVDSADETSHNETDTASGISQ